MTQRGGSWPAKSVRKRVRGSRATGKAGMRLVEGVLEAADLVVQRVETENDIGRDAFVDLVLEGEVTGHVVALQVKAGASHRCKAQWVIPGTESDFTLWRESGVPMFGVVHDPATNALRWVNLSEVSHRFADATASASQLSQVVKGPYGRLCVVVPEEHRLDQDAEPFVSAAIAACARMTGPPVALLLSQDPRAVRAGLSDSFALGRSDATALRLVAALVSRLPPETLPHAVAVLAQATHHPDIPWTDDNWVATEVKRELDRTRWGKHDVVTLLNAVPEDGGMGRGSLGQSIYHVLDLDSELDSTLERVVHNVDCATKDEADRVRFWAAAILQYHAGEAAKSVIDGLLRTSPDLHANPHFQELESLVRAYGWVDLF